MTLFEGSFGSLPLMGKFDGTFDRDTGTFSGYFETAGGFIKGEFRGKLADDYSLSGTWTLPRETGSFSGSLGTNDQGSIMIDVAGGPQTISFKVRNL